MLREAPRVMYALLCAGLVLANVAIYHNIFVSRALTVSALDVGKGDATLVLVPNGAIILIDTGPDASILRALGRALPPWQRKIDLVVLTSTKKSSVGGLPDVLNRYTVSQQITIAQNKRFSFNNSTYIDIVFTPTGPIITPSN